MNQPAQHSGDITPSETPSVRGHFLDDWRSHMFDVLNVLLVYAFGPLLMFGAFMFLREGLILPAAIEGVSYILILVLIFTKSIPTPIRQFVIVLILYSICVMVLIYAGPVGAGTVSLALVYVIGVTLLPSRQVYILTAVNAVVFVLLSVGLYFDLFGALGIVRFGEAWAINAVVTVVGIAACVYLVSRVYDKLDAQIESAHFTNELLRTSEEQYRTLSENISDVIWVYATEQQNFIYASQSVKELCGYTSEEFLGLDIVQAFDSTSHIAIENILNNAHLSTNHSSSGNPINTEVQMKTKDGRLIWVEIGVTYRTNEHGEVTIIGVTRNIADRKAKEDEIAFLLEHDALTGLLNRNAIRRRAGRLGALSNSSNQSILLINLDNFRVVNESLGYHTGDRVLKQVAGTITSVLGKDDTAYRYAGDEFVVVTSLSNPDALYEYARLISNAISDEIKVGEAALLLTASIGISVGDSISLNLAIKRADAALYSAKKQHNSIVFYSEEIEQLKTREAVLAKDMRSAIDRDEFSLHFQPVIDARTGRIAQAEALLRWNHPTLGQISPLEFISIAEHTRLIIPLTNWVLDQACHYQKIFEMAGMEDIVISVNLSIVSFELREARLFESIEDIITRNKMNPSRIKLEITESALIREPDQIIKVFETLKNMGLKLALDDFGTGYSSFEYLKSIPFDIVKLDRSLLTALDERSRDKALIASMLAMLHTLGFEVVAEGVETHGQAEFLRTNNCDYLQGYFFSRPLPPADFISYYQTHTE